MNGSIELSGEDYHRLLAEAEQARELQAILRRVKLVAPGTVDELCQEHGVELEQEVDRLQQKPIKGGPCETCQYSFSPATTRYPQPLHCMRTKHEIDRWSRYYTPCAELGGGCYAWNPAKGVERGQRTTSTVESHRRA